MALVKSRAISLRSYRLGETSRVVVCYTRGYGKVRLVAKGARRGGGRLGAALEPMVVSGVVFYLHQGRELSIVSQADVERQWAALRRDVVRMAYAGAGLELVDLLVSEREPDAALFDLVERFLDRAASAPEAGLDEVFWEFEVSLAGALGYGPELARCVACGGELSGDVSFAARMGGLLCGGCFGREPGARRLSGAAAAALSRLSRGGGRDGARKSGGKRPRAARRTGGGAGALSPAARDEVSGALRGFLEEHSGRELRLRSLDFLAQVRRAEHPPSGSESTHEG